MIKLGVDLLNFKSEYTGGLNSFSLGLLKSLEKKCNLNIYTNKNSFLFLKKKFPKSNIIIFSKNKFFSLVKYFCIIFNIENLLRYSENYSLENLKKKIDNDCDVLYSPLSYLGICNLKIPTVTSIHDLQHHHFPEFFNIFKLKYRNLMFKLTINNSSIIQASTNFIKRDIKKFYPHIKNKKIKVIHEGVSDDFKYSSYYLKNNNYIFFPAQLWPHKNHMIVLKALKFLSQSKKLNLKLIMTGGKFSAYKEILYFIKKNKHLSISYLGSVSFKKILILYKNCKFLISPSIYESSSIPILEACKIGRPIIASKSESNLEMGKKIKINFFKTNNYIDLAQLILKIWDNKKLLTSQVDKNKKIIKQYSWDNISNEYLKLFINISSKKFNF